MLLDHSVLIRFPYQLEYREGAMLMNMQQFLVDPSSLYSWDTKPLVANVYGFLYFIVATPFVFLFGLEIETLRWVSAIAIWSTVLLCSLYVFKHQNSLFLATAAGCTLYSGILTGTTPIARPDTLGMFLFVASLLIAAEAKGSIRSLVASSLIAMMAALAKPYFLMAIGLISLDIWIRNSFIKAAFYFSGSILVFVAIIVILGHESFFPSYISEVWGNNAQSPFGDLGHSIYQIKILVREYWGLLFLFAIAMFQQRTRVMEGARELRLIPNGVFGRLLSVEIQPFFTYTLVAFLMCFFYLATTKGNYLVYFIQLCLPFAALLVFSKIGMYRAPRQRILGNLLRLTIVLFTAQLALNPFDSRNLDSALKGYERLAGFVSDSEHAYGNPILVSIFLSQNRTITDNGITQFFGLNASRANQSSRRMADLRDKWLQSTHAALEKGVHDRLFITRGPHSNAYGHQINSKLYRKVDSVSLALPSQSLTIDVYDRIKTKL